MAGRRKIDTQELIALANQKKANGKPYTQTEIADQLGVTRVAVARALAKLSPSLISSRDVKQYRDERADILAELQQTMMRHITPDKLARASLSQIITAIAILYDKERLETGQSTSNMAVAHKTDDLPPEIREQLVAAAKNYATKRIEESVQIDKGDNY